jgi:hypothetical protein
MGGTEAAVQVSELVDVKGCGDFRSTLIQKSPSVKTFCLGEVSLQDPDQTVIDGAARPRISTLSSGL